MNTKILIDTAIINSTTEGRKGFSDRLFAWWFNRLVYAQIWEDPRSDLAALQIKEGEHLLTISSGGCNALAYLSANPAVVHAVDLNEAHHAMFEMKRQAFRHLPSYEDVLAFLGDAAQADNAQRYRNYIAEHLPVAQRSYWESRVWGRPRYTMFCRHAYRHGLLGRFIGLSHLLVKLAGGNLSKLSEACSMDEQRVLFERYLSPVFQHPIVRWLANRPTALYSLGIPQSQFDALKRDANGSLSRLFHERMRHLACDFPYSENCFAQQAFARRYDVETQTALPMYLQRQHYETIRANTDRVHFHHTNLTDFLRTQTAESLDAYLFLDAQDWMDQQQLTDLWREVTRTARSGARVVFRSGGADSPLEGRVPVDILARWHTDPVQNLAYYATDRSAIYGGMHLYSKC
jgi:S-adenosylmethionine-diacylglycerol 3-amino-3-carboxypropyl transferase